MKQKQTLTSWGNFPKTVSKIFNYKEKEVIKTFEKKTLIPRGNGRSYGDCALGTAIVDMTSHDYFIGFDEVNGEIQVQSGVLLSDILSVIIPKGWFLKVVPGTKLITVGGAIASDVHGKNHHNSGCFSESIIEFTIMDSNGKSITCSREINTELFKATCGGQGLTGMIVDVKLALKKIESTEIEQTTIKNDNLKQTFSAFEDYATSPYSVAWVDCLAKDDAIGKSLLMVGDFANDSSSNKLTYKNNRQLYIPFYFPRFLLNQWTVKLFNKLYYAKVRKTISRQTVSIDDFFFPLDKIKNWNRIYGKKGFVQYQFILPKENSYQGLKLILEEISKSSQGSFLAVLKLYGPANENYLSFPLEGYSLALDFKLSPKVLTLLDKLDSIVNKYGGRIYLAKDARIQKQAFEKGYPQIEKFRAYRQKQGLKSKFESNQSQRLEL